MAPQMLSAPGAFRVKCPWHLQCSVPLALSLSSLHSILHPYEWVLVPSLLPGCQSTSGWLCNFPPCCGVPHGLHIPPGNGVDSAILVTVSPIGNWADSSCTIGVCNGIVHCPMSACCPHCNCHMFTSILLLKEIIFVWLLVSVTSWPTCASWWCCLLSWGWLVMWSSWVLHL